jgi:crotonobetaine/carnitine-CoA ligase
MYSGAHDQRRWVLPAVLDEQADVRGDELFVTMTTGESVTYGEMRDQAAQVAGMLAAAGGVAGDRIAVMMPSGLDFLRAWAGIGRLGAVAVLLNTELTAGFLAHPLADAAPTMLIIDVDYASRLDDPTLSLSSIRTIFVAGSTGPMHHADFAEWRDAAALDIPLPRASDLACIMYTSGTTGAPKGVLMPHAHCFLFGYGVVDNCRIVADDRYYVALPLSHANGLLMQIGAVLIAGAHATVRAKFSASAWLTDIRASGATVTHSLGAISAFVIGQPLTPHDRAHDLRLLMSAPNHPDHDRVWRERFGIADVIGGYGMTEVNIPLYGRLGDVRPGTCGKPYDRFFEVEIRDPETDFPLAGGEVGEIMARPRVAQGFMAGYVNLPDKTVEAWRNLWFHTGDAGRLEPDGYITFVDRIKDCIRRRGENVSATDVEATLAELPGVAEVAAYAVPSDISGGEDEIMCAIVCHPEMFVEPTAIRKHTRARMPRFAQPRYVVFVQSLPRTSTEKVQKAVLRTAGVTASTIDLNKL